MHKSKCMQGASYINQYWGGKQGAMIFRQPCVVLIKLLLIAHASGRGGRVHANPCVLHTVLQLWCIVFALSTYHDHIDEDADELHQVIFLGVCI